MVKSELLYVFVYRETSPANRKCNKENWRAGSSRDPESQASYTENEIRISLDLFEKGYTVDAIAERFGKSALTLVGYLESKGIDSEQNGDKA